MILTLTPHRALHPYIHHYIYCEIGGPGQWTHSSMAPPGCTQLSIVAGSSNILIGENDKPACKFEPVTFIGQTTRFKKVSFYGRIKSFFVIFKPYGAYQLLGIHQGKCRDACINLTDLLGSRARYFEEEVSDQLRVEDLQSVLEKFFLKKLLQSKKQTENARLACIAEHIRSHSHLNSSIKEICLQEGYSIRTLERRMKKTVGLSPKQYQRIMRFNKVLQYLKENRSQHNWSRIANLFGYYDQTHFIKEFKLFYGKTPAQYSMDDNRFLSDITHRYNAQPTN